MNRNIGRPALGIAAAFTLLLTGCGEAADGGSSSAASSSAAPTDIDDDLGAEFSGGTAGQAADDSETPIVVGLINQEGGQVSNPEGAAAVQAAFDYINAEQGGIGGHPLELQLCRVTSSEEEAQQCAQQFLNDDSVDVVMQGGLNVGTNAVHETLGGAKPDLVVQANPGTDATAENTFALNPSVLAALPGTSNYANANDISDVAIVVSDDPGNLGIAQFAQGLFQEAGLTAEVTTFPAGSTDLTAAYTAALADDPDAIAPIVVTTSGCVATANALEAIGSDTMVLGSALCATQDVADALGDFPQWAFESTVLSLFAPDDTGQVDFYRAVMNEYAGEDPTLGINAPASFGAAFMLSKVLNGIGADSITPESVSSGLADYTDGVLLGTPQVAFGSVDGSPTLSGLADRYYIYDGNGDWTVEDWQSLPE